MKKNKPRTKLPKIFSCLLMIFGICIMGMMTALVFGAFLYGIIFVGMALMSVMPLSWCIIIIMAAIASGLIYEAICEDFERDDKSDES